MQLLAQGTKAGKLFKKAHAEQHGGGALIVGYKRQETGVGGSLLLQFPVILRMDPQHVGSDLAEGETDWVFVEAGSGKLRSIPKNIQALFEIVPEEMEPGNQSLL